MTDRTCHTPCPLCGSDALEVVSMRDRDGSALRTVLCTGCGLVRSDPMPADLDTYYREHYRQDYKGTFIPKPKHVVRAGRAAVGRWQLIADLVRPGRPTLDLGAGGGEFAYLLKSLGAEPTGIEPNRGYGGFAASEYGLEILPGSLFEHDFAPDRFALVTMWHVLEHIARPAEALARVRPWLADDGHFVIEVPNVEPVQHAPSHRFFRAHVLNFNPYTLARLAGDCGFEVVRTWGEDGGNCGVVLRKSRAAATAADGDAPAATTASAWTPRPPTGADAANVAQVRETLARQTTLSYLASGLPVAGFLRKCVQYPSERWFARGGERARVLLDRIYAQARIGTA